MSVKEKGKAKGWSTLWIWVVLAFVLLVGAWVTLIDIANRNVPEPIPLTEGE